MIQMTQSKEHIKAPSSNSHADGSSPVNESGNEGSSARTRSPDIDQLYRGIADVSIDSTQGTGWEIVGRKSKDVFGATSVNLWGSLHTAPTTYGPSENLPQKVSGGNTGAGSNTGNISGQTMDSRKPSGQGNPKSQQSNSSWESVYKELPPAIPSLLQHGWQWASIGGSSGAQSQTQETTIPTAYASESDSHQPNYVSDDDDELVDDSDADNFSDDYDSDESQKSHGKRKKNKWLKPIFDALDSLTVNQINEQTRRWHCPACHDGPGAINWFKGMQPLIAHAKTKGTTRLWLHRELAELLEEELQRRGASVIPAGKAFGDLNKETTIPTAYASEADSHQPDVITDDHDELADDSDNDFSDDYDSDESQKSHGTRKKNKWLKPIFEAMDSLTFDQINEQTRRWHCPACHDGPGAINWFKGMQRLITHAKTKGTTRVWLHRELAELLEEELQRRGNSAIPSVEAFGKLEGLHENDENDKVLFL
ncbi:protein SUPPRESSOR OF GENE SILENCING 3-like protein [Iris pallida]|uniref:Protein SUPPRESSOR OF GENE SILENCING 3-like protein n=1 Tax=Iris pallida TaxID=29817 RepID=A0AAX6GHV4_IRIPA|nr:protein SUPPRESSOR OF GENE SILENCING 3-like protein [Iris pallida]